MLLKAFLLTIAITASNNSVEGIRSSRVLSNELIAGFEPSSVVTDHNALDLDQKVMEEQLDTATDAGFAIAQSVYTKGGHSKSFAVLQLTTALTQQISEGTTITGSNEAGDVVTGVAYTDADTGATEMQFRYDVSSDQETYSTCQVGGLPNPNTVGCLKSNGTLTAGAVASIAYTYPVESGNQNGRTLQFFSTSANVRMRVDLDESKPYYEDFQKFLDYYGEYDYSDRIVNAAFSGSSITLNNKVFDFSSYELAPRAEVVAKTSAYLGVAMYVLRELEDALDDCVANDPTRNGDSVQALDEAVAFYTGSLVGPAVSETTDGVFIYTLANKRCANFKTCGSNGDATVGTAKVNLDIFKEFTDMKANLAAKDCSAARLDKEEIAKKLFVPMIQGTLRYAYKQTLADSDDVGEAEGAIFAAAVLPVVASCNPDSAAIIYEEMRANSGNSADFAAVKKAFESNYACMGITCADIGGIYESEMYVEGGEPCSGSGSSKSVNVGLAVGLSIGAVALLAIIFMFSKRRVAQAVDFKTEGNSHV